MKKGMDQVHPFFVHSSMWVSDDWRRPLKPSMCLIEADAMATHIVLPSGPVLDGHVFP